MVAYTGKALQLTILFTLATGIIVGVLAMRGPAAVPPAAGVSPGEVTTVGLADGAVTTGKIASLAVTTEKISDGAVTSAKITDGTIATADIADGAVTSAKIANATIETEDIEDGAVTSAKIADGTVTSDDIANGTIATADIADGAITAAKFAAGAITEATIENLVISNENIENLSINYDNIINLKISEENIENFEISNVNIENLSITHDNIIGLRISSENIENFTIGVDNIFNDNINPSVVAFAPGSASYVVATDSENGDYTDIQTAINALPATGGMVHVKEGTYTITSAISIADDNISLIGSGSSTIIRVTGAINGISVSSGKEGILIADLYIVGDGTSAVDGINMSNSLNSVIRGCRVENFTGDGIEVNSGANILVQNNFAFNNDQNGILLDDGVDNSIVANNITYLNTWDGIRMNDGENNLLSANNSFNNDKGIGIYSSADNTALNANYTYGNTTDNVDDSGTGTRNLSAETQSGRTAVGDGDTVTFTPHFPGNPNVVVSSENWERRVGVENVTQAQFNVWVIKAGDNTPLPTTVDDASNVQWIAIFRE